jgi:hypothetical protein
MSDKLDRIWTKLDKLDEIETTLTNMEANYTAIREELAAVKADNIIKDTTIISLQDQLNRLDQNSRANSIRIIGLPVTTTTPFPDVIDAVFNAIISPVLDAAKADNQIPPILQPHPNFIIDNAFAIPTKKDTPSIVIVKLSSLNIRNLIFRYKRDALPKIRDTTNNKDRNKFSIFEDLTPANYKHFHSFSSDKTRIKSTWTYGGQIRFKIHDSETVYKVKCLSDTYESLVK